MAELNFNAVHYKPLQPDEQVSDYVVWKEICKRMDDELAEARQAWRDSVRERDEIYRAMKDRSDELRRICGELEARPKPLAPFKQSEDV